MIPIASSFILFTIVILIVIVIGIILLLLKLKNLQSELVHNQNPVGKLENDKTTAGTSYKIRSLSKSESLHVSNELHVPLMNSFKDVPFNRAFEECGFEEIVTENALESVNSFFRTMLPNISDGTKIIKSVSEKPDRIIFTMSEKGRELLKTGQAEIVKTADGRKYLPQIRGVKDKKIKEIFKANIVREPLKLTRLVNAAVSLAHVVSSMDLVKRIEKVDQKLDLIISGRQNQKIAKLESCYRMAGEIKVIDESSSDIQTLFNIHRDLLQLRSEWKRDVEYVLKNIQDPNSKFFTRLFRGKKSKDRDINESVAEVEENLKLLDFTIKFDYALCTSLNHSLSIQEDITSFEYIIKLLIEKENYLSDEQQSNDIKRYLKYLVSVRKGALSNKISELLKKSPTKN